jgi:hypothetical protein
MGFCLFSLGFFLLPEYLHMGFCLGSVLGFCLLPEYLNGVLPGVLPRFLDGFFPILPTAGVLPLVLSGFSACCLSFCLGSVRDSAWVL